MEVVEDPVPIETHLLPSCFVDREEGALQASSIDEGEAKCLEANGIPVSKTGDLPHEELQHELTEMVIMEIVGNDEQVLLKDTAADKPEGNNEVVEIPSNGEVSLCQAEPEETVAAQDHSDVIVGINDEINTGMSIKTDMSDDVVLETEIFIETGDGGDTVMPQEAETQNNDVTDSTNDIRNHLEEADVDMNDTSENNNSGKEIFNKEELLDILQGNDKNNDQNLDSEARLALKQLSNLKNLRKRRSGRLPKAQMVRRSSKTKSSEPKASTAPTPKTAKIEKSNIVNALVQDWDDDEENTLKNNEVLGECDNLLNVSNEVIIGDNQESSVVDETTGAPEQVQENGDHTDMNTSVETEQTHSRRVIKKKIIFDPDNPDTFTKGKNSSKTKESRNSINKDQPANKKPKTDPTTPRKSKSPILKTQWKKPTPKINRRLTEVDKLLMDEGAVNMIADVTPEASKGKKTMRNKAEMIKKINQSNSNDSKEMKFRERKKDTKTEEETKKGSKKSSAKTSAACDDFETHSADDSIIYRRHSSSSYSSACMSPRPIIEGDSQQGGGTAAPEPDESESVADDLVKSEVFTADLGEQIKKEDCLSLKQKLNSKLTNVLNKRKSDEHKTPKSSKQRKRNIKSKVESCITTVDCNFKTLTVSFENCLAIIKLTNTGLPNNAYDITALKEFEQALNFVDSRDDISTTLLTSESSVICSVLDLKPLLEDDPHIPKNYSLELCGWVRSLLLALEQHSKLLVCGVSGVVQGLGLAVLLLCDLVLASDQTTLHVSSHENMPCPGVCVLTLNQRNLPQNLINDLVLFGRKLSAHEAMKHGIVSRIPLPSRFQQEIYNVVRDISAQPKESVLLKKRMLKVRSAGERDGSALCSSLLAEQDLFLEFWTANSNKALIRSYVESLQESFLGSL